MQSGPDQGHRIQAAPALDPAALPPVLHAIPDAILVVDRECRVLWANATADRLRGAPTAGVSGLELVHPDDLELALRSLETVQLKEAGGLIEVRLRTVDGWRLVELIGARIDGLPPGTVVLSIRDITERRRFEVASDHVAKFQSMVHNATAVTMLVSATGEVQAASAALTRLLGHDPEVVESRPLTDLVAPGDHAALAGAFTAAIAGRPGERRDPQTVEVEMRRRDGGPEVPFELSIVNLVDDPTVGAFVVSGHDVSTRKTAEAELRDAMSLLGATLESTADGVLVVDRGGRITLANRTFAEMWHIPDEILRTGDDSAALACALAQLADPESFSAKVGELYSDPTAESFDTLDFLDGRVFERYSQPQRVGDDIVGRVWSFRDVTDRRQLQRQLEHQAFHDPLTGLANQSLFRDRIGHGLARLKRRSGSLAVLFIDLDNFKMINDSLGHTVGDQLLVAVTERLTGCLRPGDTAARMGGDEFAVLLEDTDTVEEALQVSERLIDALRPRFNLGGTDLFATASIGIAFGTVGSTTDQVLRNADLAMYTAKRQGKDRYQVFRAEMHTAAIERLRLEADLRRAVERDELVLYYQPIVELGTGHVVGAEGLVRWIHPTRGLLSPAMFIEMAEETGLIEEIDQWVLECACAQVRRWQADGVAPSTFSISVNLSAHELVGVGLMTSVAHVLARTGLDPSCLTLEISEGAMLRDDAAAIGNLRGLKRLGVRLAVDDFGTGYSSLAYLQRFPIDILKIDKSFVDRVDGAAGDRALPHAIVRLAQTMDLVPIAEGVERSDQANRLAELGCRLAQGFFFAPPVEPAVFAQLLLTDPAISA